MMNGVDISSFQSSINIAGLTTTDFVIVKATQGLTYVNPYFTKHASDTMNAGKLLGIYHYAGGNNAAREAEFFYSKFNPYLGTAIPVLDWEGYQNSAFSKGPVWVKAFVERFYALSKVYPMIYMSKSVCRSYSWSWVAQRCALWCAQYANNNTTNYQSSPWTDSKGWGAWKCDTIRQYSSKGRITGYNANIDINIAYVDKAGWQKIAQGDNASAEASDTVDYFPGPADNRDYIIKAYQSVLSAKGFYDGSIDAWWGPKSIAAAKAFQRSVGIDVNGIMGEETVLRLFGLKE